ncbi:ABC transporter ATP-binding protein [Orrella sp. 11846]|uniref:ABC transporter ATP-binding protein n=1 Tax=Orrella sp. 11846 TaxID=3409913 RepID=UPI003B5C2867
MLRVTDLNCFYGQAQAVWDVSFNVKAGEIVTIIGANGAGKTTILKSIVSLVKKTGQIHFDGQDISQNAAHQMAAKGVAYVPEGRQIFPAMTVRENLIVGSYNKRAKSRRFITLDEVLEIFPSLQKRLYTMAGSLSGGEQQMLAIGRAMMAQPSVMLLDEPSLGISPILTEEIFAQIERMRGHMSIVLVEQHVQHALAICDRGYVVENGRIILEGDGAQLRANPQVQEAYLGI